MTYLVGKVIAGNARQARAVLQDVDGSASFERTDCIKKYYPSKESAIAAAEKMALDKPGEQYAVFGMIAIREAQKPATPKLISKVINEAGEIVLES